MSKLSPFAEETREQVTRCNINQSTAKTLWSFSKEKRFEERKPVCPYVSYQTDLSTLTKRKTQFGSSVRKVFTECSEAPSSWAYHQSKEKEDPTPVFALSRDKCVASSYLPFAVMPNPGPGRYLHSSSQQGKKGYTMRPKTANNRTYFIDNKEMKDVPSPGDYEVISEKEGKTALSKFRTTTLGNFGLQTTNERFKESRQKTPSPFVYRPQKNGVNKYSQYGKMGSQCRRSFIDDISHNAFTPAPGTYKPPSEFGHYRKNRNSVV